MNTQGKPSKTTRKFRPMLIFFRDFRYIHLGLGLTGNLSFFVGSIFFLWESTQTLGTWLFIVGSFGMLIGSFGSLMVTWEEYARNRNSKESKNAGKNDRFEIDDDY